MVGLRPTMVSPKFCVFRRQHKPLYSKYGRVGDDQHTLHQLDSGQRLLYQQKVSELELLIVSSQMHACAHGYQT
jgi:hypothetical protein